MEESDSKAAEAGAATESEAGLVELALMFDLTGEEIEKLEESADSLRTEASVPGMSVAVEPALPLPDTRGDLLVAEAAVVAVETGPDRMGAPPGDLTPAAADDSADGAAVVDAHRAVWSGVGVEKQPDWARKKMTRRADFERVIEFSRAMPGQGWLEQEATGLEAVEDAQPVVHPALVGAVAEGAMERAVRQPGLFARPSGLPRFAAEFLGPAPAEPLPETPVLAAVAGWDEGDEVVLSEPLPEPEAELAVAELDVVSPASMAFPSWADAVPLRAASQARRRSNPWLPERADDAVDPVLRNSDTVEQSGSRAGFGRPLGRVDDVEPFDLQHVALITEGQARRDVFRKSENLGEEIIVRLTFPPKPAVEAEVVKPVTETVKSVTGVVPETRFSPATLVSLFAQAAAEAEEESEESAEQLQELPVGSETAVEAATAREEAVPELLEAHAEEVAAAELPEAQEEAQLEPAMVSAALLAAATAAAEKRAVQGQGIAPDAPIPWVAVETAEELSTIPVWQTDAAEVAEAVVEAVEEVPVLEGVEPFDMDRVKRVLREQRTTVAAEREGLEEATAHGQLQRDWGVNPWASGPQPGSVVNQERSQQSPRPQAEPVVQREVVRPRVAVAPPLVPPFVGEAEGIASLTTVDAGLLPRAERVEPFELGQLISLVRARAEQASTAPVTYVLEDNPWNREQLPPGDTGRESVAVARPPAKPALKVEVKASKLPPKAEEVRPVTAPRPTGAPRPAVPSPAGVRVEVRGARVATVPAREPSLEPAAAPAIPTPSKPAGLELSEVTAAEMALLAAIRESARLASESANVVRESAVLAAESANAVRRAVQSPRVEAASVPAAVSVKTLPPPVAVVRPERVVVPVERMFSGISNALGDAVGSVVGRRLPRRG
ncbi:MAG: hypothetical protein HQL90_06675 [Magnetococcales bacterium]|nr:hypothetical protein [Magnetococcales bacterium]